MDQNNGESLSKGCETPSDLVISAFRYAASTWNLCPLEGWDKYTARISDSNVYPTIYLRSVSTEGAELSVRILQIFDEKLIFYVKRGDESRTLHITFSEFFKQTVVLSEQDRLTVQKKLEQRLNLALFAPLLQPHGVYPALPMLPTTPLLHIFSYLSAQELCRVGQVTKSLTSVSNSDEVWRTLVAKDFAVMSLAAAAPLPIVTVPAAATTGPSATRSAPGSLAGPFYAAESSAKDTYRYHHQQKVAALRRERYLVEQQDAQLAEWDEWIQQQRAGYGFGAQQDRSGLEWQEEPWLPSLRLPMPGFVAPSLQGGHPVPGFHPLGLGWNDHADNAF